MQGEAVIPASYAIVLLLSGVKWEWHIEDSDADPVKSGSALDYTEACADALKAFDALRQKETETRL